MAGCFHDDQEHPNVQHACIHCGAWLVMTATGPKKTIWITQELADQFIKAGAKLTVKTSGSLQ